MRSHVLISVLHVVTTVPRTEELPQSSIEYIDRLKEQFIKAHVLACKRLKRSAEFQKLHYDHRAGKASLEEGQAVWIFNHIS